MSAWENDGVSQIAHANDTVGTAVIIIVVLVILKKTGFRDYG
jgi:hypothetical protein